MAKVKVIRKCARKFDHIWRKVLVTKDHEIMECERCHGKRWKLRKD